MNYIRSTEDILLHPHQKILIDSNCISNKNDILIEHPDRYLPSHIIPNFEYINKDNKIVLSLYNDSKIAIKILKENIIGRIR